MSYSAFGLVVAFNKILIYQQMPFQPSPVSPNSNYI